MSIPRVARALWDRFLVTSRSHRNALTYMSHSDILVIFIYVFMYFLLMRQVAEAIQCERLVTNWKLWGEGVVLDKRRYYSRNFPPGTWEKG